MQEVFEVQNREDLVDWLGIKEKSLSSSDNRIVVLMSSVKRSFIHKYNLLHRGIGVLLLSCKDDQISVFVHQRSPNKRIFPSMWDMFIGGISTSGESPVTTLIREVYEECGVDLLHSKDSSNENIDSIPHGITYCGETIIKTNYNHCVVSCYIAILSELQCSQLHFRDGEIVNGKWWPITDLIEHLRIHGDSEFVPDGMQVELVMLIAFWT
jgi:8-oxo-dGTP pyrophosphatase MutT (NUDIX family)